LLDAGNLIETAIGHTGLDDFGETPVDAPLAVLTDSLIGQANLSWLGRLAVRHHLLGLLTTRLRLVADWTRIPGIQQQAVRRPIFITGAPRSGSSFLHTLLAQDPANRVPAVFEVMYPRPDRPPGKSDPRVARAARQLRLFRYTAPRLSRFHTLGPTLPQECIAIASYSLYSEEFTALFRIPAYDQWLKVQEKAPALAFHRRFLRHLQWHRRPDRWVLKSPDHVFHLDALFDTYPDAHIIQTHRDPMRVLGSTANLIAVLRGAFSHRVDRLEIGSEELRNQEDRLERILGFRELPTRLAQRIIDLRFHDLVRDPMGCVARIYDHCDIELTADANTRMRAFLNAEKRKRRRRQTYDLGAFGLDPAWDSPTFARYRSAFGLEPETGG
jgi:hypothetical protein